MTPPPRARTQMHNDNRLKLGLFGANCSSGRAVTHGARALVGELAGQSPPRRRSPTRPASSSCCRSRRWKGYGGDTDYQGATLETVTWATGLLAKTRAHDRVRHGARAAVPSRSSPPRSSSPPTMIGEGRFGLNVVCGWNEGEFEMFGATLRDHESRYEYAQEWLDAVKLAWSSEEEFDFDGALHQAQERARLAQALRRHAPGDHECRRVRHRPGLRHPQLRRALHVDAARDARKLPANVRGVKALARARGPRARLLHGRRHHLHEDDQGGRGLLPSLRRRACRLERGRQHPRDEATSRRDRTAPRCSQRLRNE